MRREKRAKMMAPMGGWTAGFDFAGNGYCATTAASGFPVALGICHQHGTAEACDKTKLDEIGAEVEESISFVVS